VQRAQVSVIYSMKRIFICCLVILNLAGNAPAQTPLTIAKDFSVKDLEGNTHHLFDYLDNNKYVLLDFFTTTCGSCQTYAHHVSASYSDFGCNNGNVVVLGINWGSNNINVHAFDSVYGAFYPAVSGTQGGGNRVVDTFQIMSYPTVILIAPGKEILEQYIWPPSQQQLDSIISTHGGLMQSCTVGFSNTSLPVSENVLSVWPDQSSGLVSIGAYSGSDVEISIVDLNGRLKSKYDWTNDTGIRLFQIKEISGLKPGLFIAILRKDGTIIGSRKFLVKE
jgi:thiol-disulfide isomerase/thioredoxin